MKKTLIGLGLIGLLGYEKAESQVNADIEAIKNMDSKGYVLRTNTAYELPLNAKGYTFMEYYPDKNYLGKTTLTKKITGNLDAAIEAVHTSYFKNRAALGLRMNIPAPENAWASITAYPAYMDTDGKRVSKSSMIGYSAGIRLSDKTTLSGFGQVNTSKGEWGYGEAGLERKLSEKASAAYNLALWNKGNLAPKAQHRLIVKYKF